MAVELSVSTQLSKIAEELQKISKEQEKVGRGFKDTAQKVSDSIEDNANETSKFLTRMRSLGATVSRQLKQDFRSLLSLNAITDSLKLSEQFKGTIREAVTLGDVIRKVGSNLGIVEGKFAAFQARMVRGLGAVGLSSEAAGNAMLGLAETPVRGQNNVLNYSVRAGQLASVSRENGQEGAIAKGLADIIVARGGNANDLNQLNSVANDVLRIRSATGKGATEIVQAMSSLFSSTNSDFKGTVAKGGGVSLAAASLFAGKDATSFLERYLGLDKGERAGMEAQGLGKLLGKNGELDPAAFSRTMAEAKSRGLGGNAEMGLKTMGLSDQEAKGFIRLAEALKQNGAAIEEARKKVVDLNQAYRDGRGLNENFQANLNRVKGMVSGPIGYGAQMLTRGLGKTAESDTGALAATVGSGALAALLAGWGLRGAGKGLLGGAAGAIGGLATGAAVEGATGRQVQPVYVVNAAEIGGGMGGLAAGATGAGITGLLGKVGLAGAGAAAGWALGSEVINPLLDKYTVGKTSEGFEGNLVQQLLFKLDKFFGGQASRDFMEGRQKIIVEANERNLKVTKQPSRGASVGP